MANTITLVKATRGAKQFQGLYSDMWAVRATIDDQDAIALTDTLLLSLTVPGLALGDHAISGSLSVDLSDGTDQATLTYNVTAANTLTLQLLADKG